MDILLNLKEMELTKIENYNTYNSKIILPKLTNNSLVSSQPNKNSRKKQNKIQMRFF